MKSPIMSIRKTSSPILHQVADEALDNVDHNGLIDNMFATMYAHKGIGLAAPQVGISSRIIVIDVKGLKLAIINPVISKFYGGQITSREGCLSFPGTELQGQNIPMVRHRHIIVEGFDENWKPIRRKLRFLASYVVQHEVDHLNGITIKG